MQNSSIYHHDEEVRTEKSRCADAAMTSTINPEMQKRMPAKSILLPVISVVMANSPKPNLMSGYAHPQAMAAVRAKRATKNGRWKMLSGVLSVLLVISRIPALFQRYIYHAVRRLVCRYTSD